MNGSLAPGERNLVYSNCDDTYRGYADDGDSRGTQAQLALALALGGDPELLILDEPATGLDVLVRRDFLESIIQLIQQEGRTVLISSHLLHEVGRVADQVVIIDNGRLVQSGSTEDLKLSMGLNLEESFVEAVGGNRRR